MNDQLSALLIRIHGMWRYRWYALTLAWVVALVGWIIVHEMPDKYSSEALLQVDSESMLRPLLKGLAVETDVDQRVRMTTQALLSRPTLERLANETDLALRARTPQQMESLLASLTDRIQLQIPDKDKQGSRDLYVISYTDTDPMMSYKVVQTLVNYLEEGALGAKRNEQEIAQQFLARQIREYDERLIASEKRLAEFKQKNMGLMPGQGGGFYARLQLAVEKLDELVGQLKIATDRLEQLRGQERSFSRSLNFTAIDVEIAKHRQDLDKLLLNYTDQHPDVLSKREIIAQLESRKQATLSGVELEQSLSNDPVYQKLMISINEAEVEVSSLRSQIRDQAQRVNDLKRMVNTIPEVEAELAKLDRDYTTDRTHRDELLARLQSAQLSDDAEKSSTGLKFRIIEPPIVPISPVGPQRILLNSIVLLAAIAAGIGLAFLLYELRPVYSTTRELQNDVGLPVLGSISMAWTMQQKRKMRLHLYFSFMTMLLLFSIYVATIVATIVRQH